MNGEKNPGFEDTLVFENDFPALLEPNPKTTGEGVSNDTNNENTTSDLFQTSPTFGSCKVITYSPRHDLTLALMQTSEIQAVIRCWTEVYVAEGKIIRAGHKDKTSGDKVDAHEDEGCVNIFENRGSMMGASAPHPHGQVWSTSL